MAKRDIIYDRIMQGGATREILMEVSETDSKGLASQMTYLRMMGKCPMKQDDGTYKIVSAEEWESYRSEARGRGPAQILTPQQRYDKALAREARASKAFDRAVTAKDNNPGDELRELNYIKADAEFKISTLLVREAEQALPPDAPVAQTEETTNSGFAPEAAAGDLA